MIDPQGLHLSGLLVYAAIVFVALPFIAWPSFHRLAEVFAGGGFPAGRCEPVLVRPVLLDRRERDRDRRDLLAFLGFELPATGCPHRPDRAPDHPFCAPCRPRDR